ncbi:MAG: CPBP family intramembrane metalloprotease [Bacilli bacterium]|nr:CPBP family intramembrane metalloprotease [Bacilli bacterium]MBP3635468.1 CPBP family intramembrane metalloprotease [Bacilli bacterium]
MIQNNEIKRKKYILSKILKNIFMFSFYFIYQIIILLFLQVFNIDTSNWNNIHKNIYLISTGIFYIIILVIVYSKELKDDYKESKSKLTNNVLKNIPIYIVGVLLMSLSNIIISKFTNSTISENEINVRNYIQIFPVYMAFSTIIYAPIVEEITFRKTFRNLISNKYLFIILSGMVFGLVHISSNTSLNDFLMVIPYIIMGIDLSYIYYKTDTIYTTMIIHSLHNLILFIVQLIGG